ncbi:probable tocopherol O-methyltransferase, chloroplastic isoform X3 [Solanum dulcamara]|uniref:probable tocopherol O-methyltransferase, chloroplastic isoform X2 n=1 Tax=Solanum dulcamara TaxID=45834 RepID=UPI0024851048|nr:probable tocopherol O-methyltransferase, chloroplastic isoform X2 [Solanum dulcamara]XP_055821031.1 probable tocopherol O-methyltransferase, chloroplastic isoform X3 [Solanum dulcamara]
MIGSTCYSANTIQSLNPTCPYSSSSSVISSLRKPQIQNNIIQNTRRRRRIITCNYNRRRMTSAVGAMKTTTSEVGIQNQQELKKGIADLYDESSGIWEDIWGDHMHHGYYQPQSSVSLSDHRSAQIRMIEQALTFASISDPAKKPMSIVDVGCGIGGSSRYLAKKYGATAKGITLSPVQAERAQALADAQGLGDKVSFQVADALNQPFPDGQFDLVWSMESGEHMPDKEKFVGELARVAAPGGTIILVTWCHRDLSPSEESLTPEEKELLNKICKAFYLPAWCSTADYVKLLQSNSLQDIKAADWSENVAPFWPAVIKSALTWRGFTSVLRSGWKTIKAALAMPLMIEGYKKGLIKFAIITCRKPE